MNGEVYLIMCIAYLIVGVFLACLYVEIADNQQEDFVEKLISVGLWWPVHLVWWILKSLAYLFWYSAIFHIVKLFKKKG